MKVEIVHRTQLTAFRGDLVIQIVQMRTRGERQKNIATATGFSQGSVSKILKKHRLSLQPPEGTVL